MFQAWFQVSRLAVSLPIMDNCCQLTCITASNCHVCLHQEVSHEFGCLSLQTKFCLLIAFNPQACCSPHSGHVNALHLCNGCTYFGQGLCCCLSTWTTLHLVVLACHHHALVLVGHGHKVLPMPTMQPSSRRC